MGGRTKLVIGGAENDSALSRAAPPRVDPAPALDRALPGSVCPEALIAAESTEGTLTPEPETCLSGSRLVCAGCRGGDKGA